VAQGKQIIFIKIENLPAFYWKILGLDLTFAKIVWGQFVSPQKVWGQILLFLRIGQQIWHFCGFLKICVFWENGKKIP
jgi:hypothetical protein